MPLTAFNPCFIYRNKYSSNSVVNSIESEFRFPTYQNIYYHRKLSILYRQIFSIVFIIPSKKLL